METFEVPLLKTKGIPASDLPNCEGWAKRILDGFLFEIADSLGNQRPRRALVDYF